MLGTHLIAATGGADLFDVASTVLLVGGVCLAVVAGALVVTVAVAVRRARRSAALATASLRLRVLTESGPKREVARMRLQLRRSVDGGHAVLGAADSRRGLPGEAPALFQRIQREAVAVDQHLRVLQTEDDRETLRAALPALRRRVDELTGLVRQLRSAVAAGLESVSDASMARLGADVQREVVALRAGRERLRDLDTPPGWPLTQNGVAR